MSNNIVVVNVSQQSAPTPNTLQKTGDFISQGGTTTAAGVQSLITQMSDLTAILAPALAITSMSWASSVVTVITAAPHGFATSSTLWITVAGAVPAAYNGNYLMTATTSSHLTFALVSNPGSETTPGTYQVTSAAELLQMGTTFFAQGSGLSVYVNELGYGSPAQGVTALNTWIAANPNVYYSHLVPREWANEPTYLTFLAQFESLTSKVFFFTTMTNANYTTFTNLMNCVQGMIEYTTIPATEFSVSSPFWVTLNYSPSSTNKVPPLSNAFLQDVTPWPPAGNLALFNAWQAAGVNYVSTGAEGGISNTLIKQGTTMDGRSFNYWYSVDWNQINIARDIANAVINGSNNTQNPLYNNQDGINRLQAAGAGTLGRGVEYGLNFGKVVQTALDPTTFNAKFANGDFAGQTVINAVPFVAYNQANPSDYRNGLYSGFSIVMTPLLGFVQIVFNITVTDFVA